MVTLNDLPLNQEDELIPVEPEEFMKYFELDDWWNPAHYVGPPVRKVAEDICDIAHSDGYEINGGVDEVEEWIEELIEVSR